MHDGRQIEDSLQVEYPSGMTRWNVWLSRIPSDFTGNGGFEILSCRSPRILPPHWRLSYMTRSKSSSYIIPAERHILGPRLLKTVITGGHGQRCKVTGLLLSQQFQRQMILGKGEVVEGKKGMQFSIFNFNIHNVDGDTGSEQDAWFLYAQSWEASKNADLKSCRAIRVRNRHSVGSSALLSWERSHVKKHWGMSTHD